MSVQKLRKGERIVGTMIRMSRNPAIPQLAKAAGLDYSMYDLEHGALSLEEFSDAAKVARSINLGIYIRVPELSKAFVSRAMDLGADGVMVPMISNREEAEKLVAWSRYSPLGRRGLTTLGEHTNFEKNLLPVQEYMEEQNQKTLCIAQIETKEAIDNIDAIASVPGLDVLLIGPNDLAASLQVPGQLMSDKVQEAISKVVEAAIHHNKFFAMHADDNLLNLWLDKGLVMIMNSLDIHIMAAGFKEIAVKFNK
ncbi:aldolase/citrate lyase family protein [Oceanispirochaeta sp.]|uniref:HpcH/HpaI aldolase family protein n=1 Tax=Oceanispirochaeta sp. TaxID=2035350 RepID=UPI00261FD29E|nr:aldolase/citrate lyase family protein [Oceanispirochaeta sp.]MDA3955662.1 aldolase/citrate lyase family protein [Oceanispirochaeta sp.]